MRLLGNSSQTAKNFLAAWRVASRIVAMGLLGASLILAQSSGVGTTAQNSPQTLKVTTRLVQVNVVVQDKKGQPVDGLTKDDFTLFDQSKPQTIASFSQERGRVLPAPDHEALPPNVFTNRFDQTGQAPGSVTIILFDALNTPLTDQVYARQQLVKFLRQVQPQDHVAIYFLTTQLKVLLEFTQDATTLLHALDKLQGYPSPSLESPAQSEAAAGDQVFPQIEEFLKAAAGRFDDFYAINRAETTSVALEVIAHHVAHVPGRKSLVWVSGSFPIAIGMDGDTLAPPDREVRTFLREIERAARALNDANIAVYPVDARGLMAPGQFSAANRDTLGGFGPGRPQRLGPDQNNFATMNTLAERTGGHAFYNTNDIQGSVRKAVSDGQSNYELAYYPNHGKWDGKFHEIKLKVDRPGLQIHYRKGYFASADFSNTQEDRKASLATAVVSPIDASSLSIRTQVNRLPAPNTGTLEFTVGLDLHEIMLEESAGRHKGSIEMIFVQKGANPTVLSMDSKTIEFNFEQKRYDELVASGISIVKHVPIAAGTTSVRVIVRDSQSAATGSVTIPIKSFFEN